MDSRTNASLHVENVQPTPSTSLSTTDLLGVLARLRDAVLLVARDHTITFLNPAALRMLSFGEDITGRDVRTCAVLSKDDDIWRGLDIVLAGGAFPVLERIIDGAAYRFELTSLPIGAMILIHNSTREQQAERFRNALISTVSHELRTPLASIKGYATTLLRKDVTWDAVTQREFLEIIDEESDRLRELIDSLLDMSKLESGVLHLERVPVQLARIAHRAVHGLRLASERHRVIIDFPRDMPLVDCDPRRIEQVLRNLIENAIKYSGNGGTITVRGQVVDNPAVLRDVQAAPNCPFVMISVSDTGPGIAEDELDRLFERFHRAVGVDQHIGGIGLGLYICKGIVEAHGGWIWAQSELGKGTTISFALPFC
jgi:signal transduction histidine kinase